MTIIAIQINPVGVAARIQNETFGIKQGSSHSSASAASGFPEASAAPRAPSGFIAWMPALM